jgi:hypothetical protein
MMTKFIIIDLLTASPPFDDFGVRYSMAWGNKFASLRKYLSAPSPSLDILNIVLIAYRWKLLLWRRSAWEDTYYLGQ